MEEFSILKHRLVPEHYLLSKEEEKEVLKKYKIKKEQLPKIKKTDAVILFLEQIYGPIEEGSVIKIVRKSVTAGYSTAYRVVVKE